ncbi:glycosyltransferase [Gallaecimonas sp. GXIMD4217]|uniref:glycosyltransferase n=1 Tax=Gallaecimonas sp. GXIMD4217 TaxID=3131927 RepID=UPI00311AE664
MTLPVIHMFWHGPALSRLERLCMASFVAQGHLLHLHVYEAPDGVPEGVQLKDATEILPREAIFRHPKTGSIAMFADWFRYKVLFEQGGIWADTDVLCLRPLDYGSELVFAWEDRNIINNAVMGLPKGHELAQWMMACCADPNRILPYDKGKVRWRKRKRRYLQGNRIENIKWGEYGPVGFTQAARHLGHDHQALPFWHFYPVHYSNWQVMFDTSTAGNEGFLGNARAVHLWNEMIRRDPGFDKDGRFPADSPFERLWALYFRSDS